MDRKQLPLVSVIVPSYNMEEYIAQTLDSAIGSSYENIEVIVVDDGSRDGSLAVAQRYAEKESRIRVFAQANQGVSVARNLALKESQGKYILPLDADDIIEPNFISEAVEVMERDSEVKAVTCRCMFFGNRTGEWNLPDFNLHKLATDNRLCATSMYRREDAVRIGGYSEIVIAREDWEFWISMLKNGGKVIKLPSVGFHYRVRAASKRFRDRGRKAQTIAELNRIHPDFFERELGGELHLQRSQSKLRNNIYRLFHPRKVHIAQGWESLEWYIKALPRIVEYAKENCSCNGDLIPVTLAGKEFWVKVWNGGFGTKNNSPAEKLFASGLEGYTPVAYYAESSWLGQTKSYCLFVKQ